MGLVLENGTIYSYGKMRNQPLLYFENFIRANETNQEKMDCSGKWILPGLIDAHVHFRVPGGEHKEDWKTGSQAAAHGGVTTVMDMPNTNPPTITKQAWEQKNAIAQRDSLVRYAFHFGATRDNFDEAMKIPNLKSVKMYMGSSTGNLLVNDESTWEKWFHLCQKQNWVMVVHAENENKIQENAKKFTENHVRVHSKIRNTEEEASAVEKALNVQQKIGNKLHIAHLTSKAGLDLIAEAKKNNPSITCEVCPHHLFLTENDTEKLGNYGKMNPSLKSKEDVRALWSGLNEGTIDCIATDHAPHTKEEKNKLYSEAPSGVPGVETMLPLLLDAIHHEKISIEKVIACCAENPSRIFGFHDRGVLEPGMLGDAVIVDPHSKWKVEGKNLFSKCGWTPFEGWELHGRVEKTIVGGKLVYA